MTTLFNVVIACAAASLVVLGWITALRDQMGTTGTAFGFATVLFLILVGTRFKIVKGFGFHAESWDQKQVEAATLIERLSIISETISRNVALIASKLGLWDSGFSNPQLAELLNKTEAFLQISDVPKLTRDELLRPVFERVKINYYNAGRQIANKALTIAMRAVDGELRKGIESQRVALQGRHAALSDAHQKVHDTALYKQLSETESLDPIIGIVEGADVPDRQNVLSALREFQEDLKYFVVHRKLRREIDLNYLYQ